MQKKKKKPEELTSVRHPAVKGISRTSWLGVVMANKSDGWGKTIASRTWTCSPRRKHSRDKWQHTGEHFGFHEKVLHVDVQRKKMYNFQNVITNGIFLHVTCLYINHMTGSQEARS